MLRDHVKHLFGIPWQDLKNNCLKRIPYLVRNRMVQSLTSHNSNPKIGLTLLNDNHVFRRRL